MALYTLQRTAAACLLFVVCHASIATRETCKATYDAGIAAKADRCVTYEAWTDCDASVMVRACPSLSLSLFPCCSLLCQQVSRSF